MIRTVTIDRIEGDWAVLVVDDRAFDVPLDLLPEGAREGWILAPDWRRDEDAERARRDDQARRVARLARDDDGGDFSL